MDFRTALGRSSRSFRLVFGKISCSMPAARAARIFSLTPPMGKISPRRVISPVMATVREIGVFVRIESRAVAMVIPAEGPSFEIEPAGAWI